MIVGTAKQEKSQQYGHPKLQIFVIYLYAILFSVCVKSFLDYIQLYLLLKTP